MIRHEEALRGGTEVTVCQCGQSAAGRLLNGGRPFKRREPGAHELTGDGPAIAASAWRARTWRLRSLPDDMSRRAMIGRAGLAEAALLPVIAAITAPTAAAQLGGSTGTGSGDGGMSSHAASMK